MASQLLHHHTPPTAQLVVRQEPKWARMSARSDRRPIDPVIVQVLAPRNLSLFVSAVLVKEDTDETVMFLEDGKTCSTHGTLISDVHHLKDPENGDTDAGFAVFADVSVRAEGVFRLRLSLYETTENGVQPRTSVFSSPFRVYISKDFPGMEASSRLACSLAKQNMKIRVRKEVQPFKKADAPMPVARLVPFSEALFLPGIDSNYVKRHAAHPVPSEPPRKRGRLTSPVNSSSTSGSPRSSSSSTSLPPISALGLPPFATSILPPPPPPPCGYGYGPPPPPGGYGYDLPPLPGAPWAVPFPLPNAAAWTLPPAAAPWPSPPHTPEAPPHLPCL